MRKKYILNSAGKGKEFWGEIWNESNIESALKFCEISPVRSVMDRYFPKEGRILDGGCGMGQFVIYYRNKGYDIEGVDFVEETVKRTNKLYPAVPIKVGDILNLEYPDDCFKAYYSGGVMEHFEEGPYRALEEARRVLCKNGTLIITVPYVNWSRFILSYGKAFLKRDNRPRIYTDFDDIKSAYLLTNKHKGNEKLLEYFNFHQYEYTKREFRGFLRGAGFKTIYSKPVSISWGMMDYTISRKVFKRFLSISSPDDNKKSTSGMNDSIIKNSPIREFMKKILVEENNRSLFTAPAVYLLGRLFGNMILFVCRKY